MKKEIKNTEITTTKLFVMILYFLRHERTYYDQKRGALILKETPKEDTYIFSCTCDDLGFHVVYMENGKNKTMTFFNNTLDYKTLSDIFNYQKLKAEMLLDDCFLTGEGPQKMKIVEANVYKFLNKENYNNITINIDEEKGIVTKCNTMNNYEIFGINKTANNFHVYFNYKGNIEFMIIKPENITNIVSLFDLAYIEAEKNHKRETDSVLNNFLNKTQQQDTTDYSIKHDKGKAKLLQVPASAIKAISEVMDYGANKYGDNLWQRVEVERYLQATARHLFAVQDIDEHGRLIFNLDKKDEESGIEHLKHAICNLAFIIELQERNKGE